MALWSRPTNWILWPIWQPKNDLVVLTSIYLLHTPEPFSSACWPWRWPSPRHLGTCLPWVRKIPYLRSTFDLNRKKSWIFKRCKGKKLPSGILQKPRTTVASDKWLLLMQRSSSQRFKYSVSEIRGAAFLEIAWLVPLLKLQSTLEISDLLGGKNLSPVNPELPCCFLP